MSRPPDRVPRWIRGVFRRLFHGTRGVEILEDLDREYAAVCERHPRVVAWGWYFAQLLRPNTWQLAWALRRIGKAGEDGTAKRGRKVRGATWVSGLPLDLKLAGRMLLRSPGLTTVGVLGLALGTAVGVGFFVALSNAFDPTLPLEEGDRIVALANWDVEANRAAPPSWDDFVAWREQMRSVQQIAAASMGYRALVTGDAAPQMVRSAGMTVSAFQVARIPPLHGRYLLPEDERVGAPRVAVLGYELWQARFEGDPRVIGQTVLVGGAEHEVVGVMPQGFALPANHQLWTALRASSTRRERGTGELVVFGRLAPGVTREQVQAELATIGRRRATVFPETNTRIEARILPYTHALSNFQGLTLWEAAQLQLMSNLLLVAIAVNMAVLFYARTATRQAEIGVRAALGASRRRIVAQLSMDALLVSTLGAALGLVSAHVALGQVQAIFASDGVPFWVDYGLQPRSVVYAVALAVLCAVVAGVVPGLKSTTRSLTAGLQRLSGSATVHLGRAWTTMIVVQVAAAVAVLPTALTIGFREMSKAAVRSTFPAQDFLTAGLGVALPLEPGMDGEAYRREAAARVGARLPELKRRLEAEPAVAGVTFEGGLPRRGSLIEVEGVPGPAESSVHDVSSTGVASDYFALVGARVLTGRDFRDADAGASGGGVVVSEAFVRAVLNGGPALGRRIRFLPKVEPGRKTDSAVPGPWLEIVGVVDDLRASWIDRELAPAMVYYPVAPGELPSVKLLVRIRGGHADGLAPRLRQITETLNPELRLGPVENLAAERDPRYLAMIVAVLLLSLTTVLLLSAAGIHALTSLTVTRRRKEIGIRTALGAHPACLLASIFSRAAWQLGLGGLAGAVAGAALLVRSGFTDAAAIPLGAVVGIMLMAGLAAAVGPALRGLRIQPMEALRDE